MKKSMLFLLTVLVLTTALPVMAQRGAQEKDPAQQAQLRTERIKEVLPDLTEDQLDALEAAHLTMNGKRQALRKKAEEDHAGTRTQMKALRDEHQAALKEILTEEQFSKWEAYRAEKGPKQGHRKGQGKKGKKGECDHSNTPKEGGAPAPKQ
jgi:protein CpxP